jgi:hypothetical protein
MEYFVTIAEFSTGIVLTPDGTWFLGDGEPRLKFESEMEARAFARHYFEQHPNHECLVTDESGHQIEMLRPALTQ